MNTAAELVDGELRGGTITRHALPCDVFGVEAMEQTRKGATCLLTERLYVCANGFRVGARRGGRLHLADKKTWEVFVMDQRGISTGNSVGWVTDAALLAAVQKLASWFDEPETFWLAS